MRASSDSGYDRWSIHDLVAAAGDGPVLDPSDATRLAHEASLGDTEALETVVRSHLRVVVDEAIRNRGLGERQSELARRGLAALVRSARRYDEDRDGPFSEHAARAVRRAVRHEDRSPEAPAKP